MVRYSFSRRQVFSVLSYDLEYPGWSQYILAGLLDKSKAVKGNTIQCYG